MKDSPAIQKLNQAVHEIDYAIITSEDLFTEPRLSGQLKLIRVKLIKMIAGLQSGHYDEKLVPSLSRMITDSWPLSLPLGIVIMDAEMEFIQEMKRK